MSNALVITNPELEQGRTKHKSNLEGVAAFGKRFSQALKDAELTESEFSRIMGVSRSAVNLWATGKSYCSIDHALRISDLLRITPEFLMFGVVATPKDRLVSSIPVHGDGHIVTQIGLPKEFMARTIPDARELKGISIYEPDNSGGMIAIADIADREITEAPRTMLIKVGEQTKPYLVSRKGKRNITVEDMEHRPVMSGTEHEFKMRHHIVGHVVASLQSGGA